jgi:hypothetical protein
VATADGVYERVVPDASPLSGHVARGIAAENARSAQRLRSSRDMPPAWPVRGRLWKASGCTDRATGADAVRYTSVDPATHHGTEEKTARLAENSQLAGRFRWWWQVMGSNHRRLSRRFYSPILLFEAYAADLRLCHPRRDLGPPPSAMRPWAPGFGVRAVRRPWQNRPRTGTDKPADGHGPTHGRGRWEQLYPPSA